LICVLDFPGDWACLKNFDFYGRHFFDLY